MTERLHPGADKGPDELIVINDKGEEITIPQQDFWQYEQDARSDGITIEEFETREGEAVYGDSNSD